MDVIASDRIVMIDVDDTIILWDQSKYANEPSIVVACHDRVSRVVPHRYNINTIRKFRKMGYTLIVWSQSGYAWAEAVVKALGLQDDIYMCMSKPRYYFDDLPCQEWMGMRVYRDPVTGSKL